MGKKRKFQIELDRNNVFLLSEHFIHIFFNFRKLFFHAGIFLLIRQNNHVTFPMTVIAAHM